MPAPASGFGIASNTSIAPGSPARMVGRIAEQLALDELITSVRDGTSATIVIVGEPGVGKTTLLDHLVGAAGGAVLRAGGVEPEQQLGYAALHRLLLPHLGRVGGLPVPSEMHS